jgi:hypothetical protein
MLTKQGTIDVRSAWVIGTDVDVVALPFTPDLVFLLGTNQVTANAAVGDGSLSFGFAMTGPTQRMHATSEDDNPGVSNVNDWNWVDRVFAVYNAVTEAEEGALEFISFPTNAFKLRVKTQFINDHVVLRYMAVCLQGAPRCIGTGTKPAAPGLRDELGIGFLPRTVLTMAGVGAGGEGRSSAAHWTLGFFNADGQQAVSSMSARDAQAAGQVRRYGNNLDCFATVTVGGVAALSDEAQYSAMLADGYRLNWLIAGGGSYYYLAIGQTGLDSYIEEFLSQLDIVTVVTENGFGFHPGGILVASMLNVESAAGTPVAGKGGMMIGFVSEPVGGIENSLAGYHSHEGTPPRCRHFNRNDACYADAPTTAGMEGWGSVKTITNDGYTFRMDDADAAQMWISYNAMSFAGGGADVCLL